MGERKTIIYTVNDHETDENVDHTIFFTSHHIDMQQRTRRDEAADSCDALELCDIPVHVTGARVMVVEDGTILGGGIHGGVGHVTVVLTSEAMVTYLRQ